MSIRDWLSDRTAVGVSGWRPYAQSNPLVDMMNGAGPSQQAYEQMFGGDDGVDGGSGVSPGTSSGVSGGTSPGTTAGTFGAQPDFEVGRNVRNIGRVAGALAPGIGGTLIGGAIGLAGTLADYEEANAHLAARGFPEINPAKAVVSSLAPFGIADAWAPEAQYNAMQGFGLGPAVEYDDMVQGAMYGNWGPIGGMGFDDGYGDAFGGWGGYSSPSNIGPGADYESDPEDATGPSDNYGGWGGYGGDYNDGPGADAESDSEDSGSDSIICTELMRQGRLSKRLWLIGTKEFAGYWHFGKRGYYLWSVPVVRHLKAHPNSRFSRFIEKLFNIRAEYVAARNGHKRYRKTILGAVVTKGMYGLCWSLAVAAKPFDLFAGVGVMKRPCERDVHGDVCNAPHTRRQRQFLMDALKERLVRYTARQAMSVLKFLCGRSCRKAIKIASQVGSTQIQVFRSALAGKDQVVRNLRRPSWAGLRVRAGAARGEGENSNQEFSHAAAPLLRNCANETDQVPELRRIKRDGGGTLWVVLHLAFFGRAAWKIAGRASSQHEHHRHDHNLHLKAPRFLARAYPVLSVVGNG